MRGGKEGNKAGSVGEQKMEKDKRSAGAVNVVFEEPSFRRPSLSDQTRVTDANGNEKIHLSVWICFHCPPFFPRSLFRRV